VLNHTKLAAALHALSDELFADSAREREMLRQVWERLTSDTTLMYQVRNASAPWPVPTWQGAIDAVYDIQPYTDPYCAVSVDGSQIYPDRHQAVACYLINIGAVVFPYGISDSVVLQSDPHIFQGRDTLFDHATSTDMVNAKRQELELQAGLAWLKQVKERANEAPALLLFDGSLIFWHLSAHEETVRQQLLVRYLTIISELYIHDSLCAWYISMPKSKELINVVRLFLCDFIPERKELYEFTDQFVDASIAYFYLQPRQRSTVFQNHAPVSAEYPAPMHPHFFYIHVGDEIGRVEIPAWIAQDEAKVDLVAQMVLDQCVKGQGYPIVLAEAHEQAVVKGADRDLFYHLIQKIGLQHNSRRPVISKKSFRKQKASF